MDGHPGAELRAILDRLPREPGVYLLKGHAGEILYVGKASNLHARVRSYFGRAASDGRAFVPLLEQLVGDIETIITRNEKEALLLENTLIKQHTPRFNVMLRDDKSYLVLRLDPRTAYPRLEISRRLCDDGARYFGPYHAASACRETLRVVNRHFLLRSCTDRAMATRTLRPSSDRISQKILATLSTTSVTSVGTIACRASSASSRDAFDTSVISRLSRFSSF